MTIISQDHIDWYTVHCSEDYFGATSTLVGLPFEMIVRSLSADIHSSSFVQSLFMIKHLPIKPCHLMGSTCSLI
jgi:hypothetical protein